MKSLVILLFLIIVSHLSLAQAPKTKVVYQSKSLVIQQLTKHTYVHTSYLQTNDFGNVPCNGLIVTNKHTSVIFDTPADSASSEELIQWITNTLHSQIKAVIPTHFHADCLGGLTAFHHHQIPSYASSKTIAFATKNKSNIPQHAFNDSLVFWLDKKEVTVNYFGAGHTLDNVVGYFPSEKVLFGGCLVKELNAGKGNLEDASVADWPTTIQKVKTAFPKVKYVVPGHGKIGTVDLLDYTKQLFQAP